MFLFGVILFIISIFLSRKFENDLVAMAIGTTTNVFGIIFICLGLYRMIKKSFQKTADEEMNDKDENKKYSPWHYHFENETDKRVGKWNGRQKVFLVLFLWGLSWIMAELINGTISTASQDWKFIVFVILPFCSIIFLIKDLMNSEQVTTDKILKLSLIVGIALLAFSFFYYFVIRPISKDSKLENCLKKAGQSTFMKNECYKQF